MNGLLVISVEQNTLVLVKNVYQLPLEALDARAPLIEVHEIGHNFHIPIQAALVLHPLFDHVAQARREHQTGYVAGLERLEERFAVVLQMRCGVLYDMTQVAASQACVHDQLIGLLPPLDHEGHLLLFGHRVIVLDRVIVQK